MTLVNYQLPFSGMTIIIDAYSRSFQICNMKPTTISLKTFTWRVTAAHVITYFFVGIIASVLLDYRQLFLEEPLSYLMRPVDDPWVAAGPGLQVIRGIIFALALWFFKEGFLERKNGWLYLWGLLIGLSILSPVGPCPGSIEGMLYTKIPILDQIKGYLEVFPQTLLFAVLVYYWYEKPKAWMNISAIVLVSIILLLSIMGVLAALQ